LIRELLDPALVERQEPHHPEPALGHALAERLQHLLVVQEVLRAARDHHLGLAGRGLQQRLQVLGGGVVGHAQRQLVEAVEQERDPALLEHVAEGGVIEPLHAALGMKCWPSSASRLRAFSSRRSFDEDRDERALGAGEPQGELVHEERLAGSEIAEHEREPRPVVAEPCVERVERVVRAERVDRADRADRAERVVRAERVARHRIGEPGAVREPLRHEEPRRIHGVALQHPGLLRHVRPEVEQPCSSRRDSRRTPRRRASAPRSAGTAPVWISKASTNGASAR